MTDLIMCELALFITGSIVAHLVSNSQPPPVVLAVVVDTLLGVVSRSLVQTLLSLEVIQVQLKQ
jgi:hypothetical protein